MNQKNHSFDFSRYFQNIALTLKDVAPIPPSGGTKGGFHRVSGIAHLEEFLHNLTRPADNGYHLVIEDNLDSRFIYNSATLLDEQYYVFYVLKRCKLNDFDAIEQAKEGCKSVAKKIWSKIFRDHKSDNMPVRAVGSTPSFGGGQGGGCLRDFRKNSITNQTIGPIADQYWGLMCSFTIADNPGIKYNENDWFE